MFGSFALTAAKHHVENPPNLNPYNNEGITLPDHGFVGPGNNVVDKKTNLSNFNQLPDNCTDWNALEHDVNYHNLGISGRPSLSAVNKIDNIAIDNVLSECTLVEPMASKIMVGGLKLKQHLEELAEAAVYPLGSNAAVYPRENSGAKEIDWFSKGKSRRRILPSEYETFGTATTFKAKLV